MWTAYLGVDPGKSGGAVVIIGRNTYGISFTTATDQEICSWFKNLKDTSLNTTIACMEAVQGYIGKAQPGSSAFKFGDSNGFIRGCLTAFEIPFILVTPQKWQNKLMATKRGRNESKTDWKRRIKQVGERLYPRFKSTLATSDALLIAEYCRQTVR